MTSAADDCVLCAALVQQPDHAWAAFDRHWAAGVLPRLEVAGWVMVVSRRHVTAFDELEPAEARDFGPFLARVMAALRDLTRAEKVYLSALGELYQHWHVLLAPRGADVAPDRRGLAYLAEGVASRDPAAALAVVSRLRDRLSPPG